MDRGRRYAQLAIEQLYGAAGKKGVYSKNSEVQLFFEAALSGNRSQVEELLSAGVDLNARDRDGLTALLRAALEDRPDTVRLLMDLGADVNAREADGSTALILAAFYGHREVVRTLLQSPEIDVNVQSKGATALMYARYSGESEIAELLRAHPQCDESVGAIFTKKDEMVDDLGDTVMALDIPTGGRNSLLWLLHLAYQSNEPDVYCSSLQRFIKKVTCSRRQIRYRRRLPHGESLARSTSERGEKRGHPRPIRARRPAIPASAVEHAALVQEE